MKTAADEPNLPLAVVLGSVAAIAVLAAIVLLQTIFADAQRPAAMRPAAAPAEVPAAVLAEQAAALSDYRWIDRQQGIVGLPIERAMQLQLQRWRAQQP